MNDLVEEIESINLEETEAEIVEKDDPLENMRQQILVLYKLLEKKNEEGTATENEQSFLEINKKTKDGKFLKLKIPTRSKEYYREYRAAKKNKESSNEKIISYSKYTIGPHAPENEELYKSIRKYEVENAKKNESGILIYPKDSAVCREFKMNLYGLNKLRFSALELGMDVRPSQQSQSSS